jgi:sigma-B regulation protein RsbU (phosphoserine phosphatase)
LQSQEDSRDHHYLRRLAELSLGFAGQLDVETALDTALQKAIELLAAEAGSIFLVSDDGRSLQCRASFGPVDITGLQLPVGKGIVGRTLQQNCGQLVRDVRADPAFNHEVDHRSGFTTRSVLSVPLAIGADHPIGVIQLLNKQSGGGLFDQRDLSFLNAVAATASLAIHNARMTQKLLDQEKLQQELRLAREIQQDLLPKSEDPRFPVYGANYPAHGVSGDLYWHKVLANGEISFALGDVSGKGMHAALVMAKTISLLNLLIKLETRPAELAGLLNRELCESLSHGMFVTMILGVYDLHRNEVRVTNAGHEPALLCAGGEIRDTLPAVAPPLGIVKGQVFRQSAHPLPAGQSLYLFSDGLTEADMGEGRFLDVEGVRRMIAEHAHLAPIQRVEGILQTIRQNQARVRDDLTLLVVEGVRGGVQLLDYSFRAYPEQLGRMRKLARTALQDFGMKPELIEEFLLALGEAAMNVVQHGIDENRRGDHIRLQIIYQEPELLVRLLDRGRPIDPRKLRSRDPDDLRPGGLGIGFMRSLMDRVDYSAPSGEYVNLLEMRKRVDKDAGQ